MNAYFCLQLTQILKLVAPSSHTNVHSSTLICFLRIFTCSKHILAVPFLSYISCVMRNRDERKNDTFFYITATLQTKQFLCIQWNMTGFSSKTVSLYKTTLMAIYVFLIQDLFIQKCILIPVKVFSNLLSAYLVETIKPMDDLLQPCRTQSQQFPR